jgi:hypothetical protein
MVTEESFLETGRSPGPIDLNDRGYLLLHRQAGLVATIAAVAVLEALNNYH